MIQSFTSQRRRIIFKRTVCNKRLKVKVALRGFSIPRPLGSIVFLPQQVPAFISKAPRIIQIRETSTSEGGNSSPQFCQQICNLQESTRVFYMPQSWDMGHIILLPLRRKAYGGFSRCPKNPTASAGFEPANSSSSGQYANH
jgi:hypothetical protein